MNHGGRRPGAGRKPGSISKRTRRFRAEVAASGRTPLEHMLAVLHDPAADPDRRDRMAIAAAPFIHPRLSAVDANVRTQVEEASTLTEAERRERARQAIAEAFAERRDPEQWQASGPVLRLVAPADDAAPPPDEAG